MHAGMLAAALSPTCAGLDCCWDGSRSPLLMGGRSVFLLRLSRSLAVGLRGDTQTFTKKQKLCFRSADEQLSFSLTCGSSQVLL